MGREPSRALRKTVNMFTDSPSSAGRQETVNMFTDPRGARAGGPSTRRAGAPPPPPTEDRELVLLDLEAPHPGGDPHPVETSAELHGVRAGEDEHGLSHLDDSRTMDEPGLVVRPRHPVVGRTVRAAEDQMAHA